MSINRILVPYNFSPEAEKALDLAVRLFAGREGARITLLYCYTPLPAEKPDFSKALGSWPAAVGQAILQNGMARKLKEYEDTVQQIRLQLSERGFCAECIDYVFKPTERDLVDEVVESVREGGLRNRGPGLPARKGGADLCQGPLRPGHAGAEGYGRHRRYLILPEEPSDAGLQSGTGTTAGGSEMRSTDQLTMESFKAIARAVAETDNLESMLDRLTQLLVGSLDIKACSIFLLDPDSHELERVADFGLSQRFLKKGAVSADRSAPRTLKGESIIIPDASRSRELQYPEETLREGIGASASVPIRYRGEVMGILRLYHHRPWNVSERDLDSLNVLAETIGIGIMHTRYLNVLRSISRDLGELPETRG